MNDPFLEHQAQVDYYNYVENQRENYIDLTKDVSNPNDSIIEFSQILFNKSRKNLDVNLSGILIEDTMEIADVFCMLLELVLYGLHLLKDGKDTIFDLNEPYDEIVYTIRDYLKSTGFDMEVREFFPDDNIDLFRDRNDYYCEIVPTPPKYLRVPGWYILNYRLINNAKFEYSCVTPLEKFMAFFISVQNKIFTINFTYAKIK
jgi:hypothetical protein